jgi:hypothetical protein
MKMSANIAVAATSMKRRGVERDDRPPLRLDRYGARENVMSIDHRFNEPSSDMEGKTEGREGERTCEMDVCGLQ